MKTALRKGWSFCLILALLAGLPTVAQGQGEDLGQKVYKQTLKGTVWILRPVEEGIITGSGAYVHADSKFGYVVTNYHVVGEAKKVLLFFPVNNSKGETIAERKVYLDMAKNNRHIIGDVIYRKMSADLAVVKIPKPRENAAKIIGLAAGSPKPADRVHSVGSPGAVGALWVYTPGSVRQVYQAQLRSKLDDDRIMEINAWMILTNSATNEGDSGGPLVNDQGHLVGITQGGSTRAQAVSTFVDILEVKTVLKAAGLNVPNASGKETAKKDDKSDKGESGSDAAGDTPDKSDTASSSKGRNSGKNEVDKAERDKIAKLAKELIDADIGDRATVLEKFQKTKGSEYTSALAAAIPRLSGSYRDKARSALAERLTRMKASTLKDYLEDDNPEIRRGAVRAIVSKDEKDLMKDLVPLLTDNVTDVADEAHEALCKMTGQKFEREPEKWKKFLSK